MTVEQAIQKAFDDLCALQFAFYQIADALEKSNIMTCQELGDRIELIGRASTEGADVPASFAHLARLVRKQPTETASSDAECVEVDGENSQAAP